VLVSSALNGAQHHDHGLAHGDGVHASLVGYVIAGNHSFDLMRKSRECAINLPTTALIDMVVEVGNATGAEIDRFDRFGFTMQKADRVTGPVTVECRANFECRLVDGALVNKYKFFIFEVVNAHVARRPSTQRRCTTRRRGFHGVGQHYQPTLPAGGAVAG
jgi:flavin reductase (DIM6/NTAB) family NADH-FMN oxidoreductase RutF